MYEWNSPDLVAMLCSALHMMVDSPIESVALVDRNRPYIVLDKDQWTWGKLELKEGVRPESFLKYSLMPTRRAEKFLLLRDLRGGKYGRVWMVCTTSGRVGVIKFSHSEKDDTQELRRQQLEKEGEVWRHVWKQPDVRVVTLNREPALLMPYVEPVESITDEARKPSAAAVRAAVTEMANAGYRHLDLAWRHVGVFPGAADPTIRASEHGSPAVSGPRVILFDLGSVSEESPATALPAMLEELKLTE